MADKKLFLLDGMALAYRGHFALIRNPRMTSAGFNASAVFVFANTLLDIITNDNPTHIAVSFDTSEPTFRHKRYPEYKAHREAMPEELSAALPYIVRLCEAFNIPVLRVPGWEADDVIGTLATQASEQGFTTYMVTPDKDYGQLVDEKTYILKPSRSGRGAEILGVKEILEQWEIKRIDQVIDILGLMGDSSDNIPGVPGVGEKTAKLLIDQYDTIENLLDHTDEIKGKRREKLEENREMALLSKELVTIVRDVPLDVTIDTLKVHDRDDARLQELFKELEFNTLGKKLFGEEFVAGPSQTSAAAPGADSSHQIAESEDHYETIKTVSHRYITVRDAKGRKELVDQLNQTKSFCFDLETTSLDARSCDIVGASFSIKAHDAWYVPFPDDRISSLAVLEEFRPLLENQEIEKVGHNLKFDYLVLKWHGFTVRGPVFDTMLAAYLTLPEMRRSMDYLAKALLGYQPIAITQLIGEKKSEQISMRDVLVDQVAEYAAEDADVTFQLSEILRPKLKEMNQVSVMHDIESPLLPVLVDMENEGIRVDVEVLDSLSSEMSTEIDAAAERIYKAAGQEFNLNSPKQLGEILFDTLKLDHNAKRTSKTGQYKTDEQVLQRLAFKHDIARDILQYRELSKLKSTYVDALPGAVFNVSGRVHTHYEQAVTSTGRMQSHDPNLQNIPIRTEQGREIRKAFVPRNDKYALLAADYSQIELRIMAELSGDEALIQAFHDGLDIHSATASRMYGVSIEDVDGEMRRKAKTVNFGIIYGISAFGLSERLNISRAEGAELIEQYFSQYPGVKQYMDNTVKTCAELGYVETISGRRRYLRDITSRNATVRKSAERNAINAPIQGTAADMIKIAMVKVHKAIGEAGLKSRMLLQVHDELVFDMLKTEEEALRDIVEANMINALSMSVPIIVEMGVGANWLEAH